MYKQLKEETNPEEAKKKLGGPHIFCIQCHGQCADGGDALASQSAHAEGGVRMDSTNGDGRSSSSQGEGHVQRKVQESGDSVPR
eukprot:3754018-Karenia_brevis.AAC.1